MLPELLSSRPTLRLLRSCVQPSLHEAPRVWQLVPLPLQHELLLGARAERPFELRVLLSSPPKQHLSQTSSLLGVRVVLPCELRVQQHAQHERLPWLRLWQHDECVGLLCVPPLLLLEPLSLLPVAREVLLGVQREPLCEQLRLPL